MSAVSMTLPPASANRSSILALTSGDAPQPQSSPKVMVPSATSEIRTPDLPKSLYLTRFPHFFGLATTLEPPVARQASGPQRPAYDERTPEPRSPPECGASLLTELILTRSSQRRSWVA